MTTAPPPGQPPADDEVERRLAALKAGIDPGSLGPRPRMEAERPPDGSGRAAETAGAARDASTDGGFPADDGLPALVGDVIGDAARTWRARETRAPGPGPGPQPPSPGVRVVAWGIDPEEARRLGLRIGLALAAFGGYLVLAEFVPAVALVGSLALAVLGGFLVGWHLAGRAGAWALHAGAVLGGFGIARVVAELASLPPAGWGTLGAGIGLLVIGLARVSRGEGIRWQAWVGGALTVYGGWGALGATIPGFPTLGDLVVPLVLVLIGVVLLRRGVRQG